MFSAIPYQEQIEVQRSNLCCLSILFDFLRFRNFIFYIIYIIDVIYGYKHKSWNFMNSNCCLQKHWGNEIVLRCSFYQVFGHILWKFGIYYMFWWKIVVPQSQNFSSFPFIFFYFYIFEKLLTSASFFQINFPFFHSSLY